MSKFSRSLGILSVLLMIGCQSAHEAPPGVTLATVKTADWDNLLAQHKGKVVVVDTWATWCLSCLEEFPGLVALDQKYRDQGVDCISVTVDKAGAHEAAHKFLTEQQATFSNYRLDDENGDAWWDKWNIKSIPVVLVFDQQGNLARKFDKDDPDNQFTYLEVEQLVEELVKAGAGSGAG